MLAFTTNYKGVTQNYILFCNLNLDLSSLKSYIKPNYTTREQFGSVLPIEMNNNFLPLGPIYI